MKHIYNDKILFFLNMSGIVFKKMLWNKITYMGMNLTISCNKSTEMSETQQLRSKVIENFFRVTRGDKVLRGW